eukprot:1557656-Pyramimonas_sp.AAC.2
MRIRDTAHQHTPLPWFQAESFAQYSCEKQETQRRVHTGHQQRTERNRTAEQNEIKGLAAQVGIVRIFAAPHTRLSSDLFLHFGNRSRAA